MGNCLDRASDALGANPDLAFVLDATLPPGCVVDTRDPRTGATGVPVWNNAESDVDCNKAPPYAQCICGYDPNEDPCPPQTVVEADTDRFALRVLVIVIAVLSLILALTTAVRPMTASAAVAPDLYQKPRCSTSPFVMEAFGARMQSLAESNHRGRRAHQQNALLAASQRCTQARRHAAEALRARALLLLSDLNGDELAAKHNNVATVWSDALPAAWLSFAVSDQATDFFVHNGREGSEFLEKAMNDAADELLREARVPNPLCVRARDVRLHLTQVGRAFHLQTSAELEPHELELECREHMHSWEKHTAEYNRIMQMAEVAKTDADWKAWLDAMDQYKDPPSLAFAQTRPGEVGHFEICLPAAYNRR